MAKMGPQELKALIDKQFQLQRSMLSLYQTIADYFYPERADFTITRNIGNEIADMLVDSYPVLMRRDLANSFSSMLRDEDWFNVGVNIDDPGHEGTMWLQWATMRLRKLMETRQAGFSRATKEGDHDFASFGQTVISTELNRNAGGLLYRCWHLRDCAWWEDETGQVCGVVRKWRTDYRQLLRYFGQDKLHDEITKDVYNKPFKELHIYHVFMPSDMYGDDQIESKYPYVSIYFDVDHAHVIEEIGMKNKMYAVPRFQTIAGSAYAYSPATIIALPDTRTLQAMTHTLLEAGERYARPPIIATTDVVRSDVDLSPDGITWVDKEYDEKMGAALRPLGQDRGGFPVGLSMRENIMAVLSDAFYLNKINLPGLDKEMTAYEFSERIKQYRRENLPLFSPMESEYNGQLLENSFDIALNSGFLGSIYDIPERLQDTEVRFEFQGPLTKYRDEEKAARFTQVSRMLADAAQVDESVKINLDMDTAFREAAMKMGAPARWFRQEDVVAQAKEAEAQKQQMMMATEAMSKVPPEIIKEAVKEQQ